MVFQNAVNGGEIGDAFADDAQGLGAVAPACMVDDEAGRVLRLHRGMAHLAGIRSQFGAHAGAGLEPGDDFHHLHQRHRVEKVEPGKLCRTFELGSNRRYRQ